MENHNCMLYLPYFWRYWWCEVRITTTTQYPQPLCSNLGNMLGKIPHALRAVVRNPEGTDPCLCSPAPPPPPPRSTLSAGRPSVPLASPEVRSTHPHRSGTTDRAHRRSGPHASRSMRSAERRLEHSRSRAARCLFGLAASLGSSEAGTVTLIPSSPIFTLSRRTYQLQTGRDAGVGAGVDA